MMPALEKVVERATPRPYLLQAFEAPIVHIGCRLSQRGSKKSCQPSATFPTLDRIRVRDIDEIRGQAEWEGGDFLDIGPKGLVAFTARRGAQEPGDSYYSDSTGRSHRFDSDSSGTVPHGSLSVGFHSLEPTSHSKT